MLVYSFTARRLLKANNVCILFSYEHQMLRKVYPRELALGKVNDVSSNIKHIMLINVSDSREQTMPETSRLTYQRVCRISLHKRVLKSFESCFAIFRSEDILSKSDVICTCNNCKYVSLPVVNVN